ncbi:hypothetical protein K504DRAFT_454636 [Pleomassaria siparia CBS 279.74]|uniref:Uncharacterized protein n=1 Tax=Pleomassaria siparia CBS 279.74 TaxID=1314801 RepID=A0A6G1KD11_9PLEO|nr:hypothetical protein K504DRAFT_454636 [Pleomassaria siparia CBS 279.74]
MYDDPEWVATLPHGDRSKDAPAEMFVQALWPLFRTVDQMAHAMTKALLALCDIPPIPNTIRIPQHEGHEYTDVLCDMTNLWLIGKASLEHLKQPTEMLRTFVHSGHTGYETGLPWNLPVAPTTEELEHDLCVLWKDLGSLDYANLGETVRLEKMKAMQDIVRAGRCDWVTESLAVVEAIEKHLSDIRSRQDLKDEMKKSLTSG